MVPHGLEEQLPAFVVFPHQALAIDSSHQELPIDQRRTQQNTCEMNLDLSERSCLTQFKTAVKTSSSEEIFSWLLEISSSTSVNGNKRNSSVPTTCWKFCSA